VKENTEKRDRKICDLWLACYTQEEIAEAVGEPVGTIGRLLADETFLHSVLENPMKKAAASHAVDFAVPLSNMWKQQEQEDFRKSVLENHIPKDAAHASHAVDFKVMVTLPSPSDTDSGQT
jgi:hypothetical protein